MSVEGFKLSGTQRDMRYFHGNGSFHLPISSLAESPAVLCAETAKRGDDVPHPQHGTGESSEQPTNKSLVFSNNTRPWEEGGRAERVDFLFWGEQHFPQCAKVHAHFPVLHKPTSSMCLS